MARILDLTPKTKAAIQYHPISKNLLILLTRELAIFIGRVFSKNSLISVIVYTYMRCDILKVLLNIFSRPPNCTCAV